MKNHESTDISQLIKKILIKRREVKASGKITISDLCQSLLKGPVEYCGERFTFIRPLDDSKSELTKRAEEINEKINDVLFCIYNLKSDLMKRQATTKDPVKLDNSQQIINFLSKIMDRVNDNKTSVDQLINPLIDFNI
jgi:hypothetical protein